MTTALGVDVDKNGKGVDPLTHRQIIRQNWNNTGVAGGLEVSGRSDLKYGVAPGMAVCSMGDADGYTEAFWPGGVTEHAVSAGDGTYARIDVVYMVANTGNPDNVVHVDVKQGTPSASPAVPSLPAGGIPLGYRLMPSGGSTTGAATPYGNVYYAIRSGASLGKLGEYWNHFDHVGDSKINAHYNEMAVQFTVPTDRAIELMFWTNFSAADLKRCEWSMRFMIDGVGLDHSGNNFVSDQSWTSHYASYSTTIAKGTHTASIDSWLQYGSAPSFHYSDDGGNSLWIGRRFQIWDRGAAQ